MLHTKLNFEHAVIIFFFFLVDKGIQGVALYPIYCLINHSCYSNTNYVKFPDLHLELRSQIPIKKGEQIYTRYISATIGNYTYIPLIILSLVGNYNGVDVLFYTILHIKFYRKHETARRHQKKLVFWLCMSTMFRYYRNGFIYVCSR